MGSSRRLLKPLEHKGSGLKKKQHVSRNRDVRLKVMGLGHDQMLVLHLVYYDTLKTLRGVLRNEILSLTGALMTFDLFSCCPRRQKLTDDSMTLNDLGLFPNAVVHVQLLRNKERRR
jgi:hypothetical protein